MTVPRRLLRHHGDPGTRTPSSTPTLTISVAVIPTMLHRTQVPMLHFNFLVCSVFYTDWRTKTLLLGTGVSLFGISDTVFTVTIDKAPQGVVNSTAAPLLFSKYGLSDGLHSGESFLLELYHIIDFDFFSVTLTTQTPPSNTSQLALDSASVSSTLPSEYVAHSISNPPSNRFTAKIRHHPSSMITRTQGLWYIRAPGRTER